MKKKDIVLYDTIERVELQIVLNEWGEQIHVNMAETRSRAEDLVNSGFGIADAAHVAFAEQAEELGYHSKVITAGRAVNDYMPLNAVLPLMPSI